MHTNIMVKNHIYMHASGSRSRIIDMCIIHTCIRVKDRGTLINASYRHVRFFILFSMGGAAAGVCIIHSSTRIHASCMHQDQGQGSRICASYICASYIHQGQRSWICASYIHVLYMHQGQGTRIIDIYHTYAHHTYMHQGQETRFIDICIIHSHASGSRII